MVNTYLVSLLPLAVSLGSWFGSEALPESQSQPGSATSVQQSDVPVKISVSPPDEAQPGPYLRLHERDAKVTPKRQGFQHTGGGVIDVTQPAPDTVIITMTGVAIAGAHPCKHSLACLDFELAQCLEVVMEQPEGKSIKLNVSARVIGLLRSQRVSKGDAEESACVTLSCGPASLAALHLPDHAVCGGKNLSINDSEGPVAVPVGTGKYTLHQSFHLAVKHPAYLLPCKALSAEFAPDPALNRLWISHWEPFHGVAKNDFGFQVTIKVTAN